MILETKFSYIIGFFSNLAHVEAAVCILGCSCDYDENMSLSWEEISDDMCQAGSLTDIPCAKKDSAWLISMVMEKLKAKKLLLLLNGPWKIMPKSTCYNVQAMSIKCKVHQKLMYSDQCVLLLPFSLFLFLYFHTPVTSSQTTNLVPFTSVCN